jgi:hypothetical protein
MILRFSSTTTLEQRAAVEQALHAADIRAIPGDGALILRDSLTLDEIHSFAALPGVEKIGPGNREYSSLRVAALGWISAACSVLGLLTVLAANLPAPLGSPADPLRTPETLRSSWPLLPVHGLVESSPDWLPVSLLPALALVLLVFWPLFGRRVAERAPRLHTSLGVVALGVVAWLAYVELAR